MLISTLYLAFLNTAKQCLLISILNSPAGQRDSKFYSFLQQNGSEFVFYGNKNYFLYQIWKIKVQLNELGIQMYKCEFKIETVEDEHSGAELDQI